MTESDDGTGKRTSRPARKRRPAQHDKKAPFTDKLPRPVKRVAGRTTAPRVPANIRVAGVELDDDDRAYIRQRLGMKLGKFATAIERVSVRVQDVNGPRGGVDQRCRIKVVLSALPSVFFESQAHSLRGAVNGALTGAERTVRRALERRQTKPIVSAARKRAVRSR